MIADDIQRDLNARFTYRDDTGESWRILKDSGQVWGDCEDYALTLVWLRAGRSIWRFWLALLTFKAVLWQCKSPNGVGHVVVWCRGYGWTDNMMQRPMTRAELERRGYRLQLPWLAPLVALKFMARPLLRLM